MNLPDFGKSEVSENSLRIKACFPEKLDWFNGHFEYRKIFPGVGQLYVISRLSEKFFGINLNTDGVSFDTVKYNHMIFPETEAVISISVGNGSLSFVIADASDESMIYSQGKISFGK